MKNEKEEELDKLFKNGMEDPVNEAVFRDADWGAMEQLLDTRKKRAGIVYWLPRLGSVAALLLLALGWWLYKPEVTPGKGNKNQGQLSSVKPKKENPGTSGGATVQAADSSNKKILNPAGYAANPVHPRSGKNKNRSLPYLPVGPAAALPVKSPGTSQVIANNVNDKKEPGTPGGIVNDQATRIAVTPVKNKANAIDGTINNPASSIAVVPDKGKMAADGAANNSAILAATPPSKQKDSSAVNNSAATKPKVKVKGASQPNLANHAVFALSALASSDLNGVNSFQGSRVGGNFGALLSVNIKKWTISTGAMYSIKPYQESYANYHTSYVFQTNPSTIGVNCRMIDIPVNVNYQVYKNHGDKITMGTGLSSYIILRENYTFNYANNNSNAYGNNSSTQGPAGYSVANRNRNIFGVLNLDATYDHQINSKFGISFQPYVKLPFSNVGESQARLQSAGVALGLSWNLNTFKKPD